MAVVNVVPTVITVTVTDNQPTVTITDSSIAAITVTDNSTSQVTVIGNVIPQITVTGATPVTVLGDEKPVVVINTGVGNKYDTATVIAMLAGQLTSTQMAASLASDLTKLADLWVSVGADVLLTLGAGNSLIATSVIATDAKIALSAVDIKADTAGKLNARAASIELTAIQISQSVTDLETSVNGSLSAHTTLINQTADDIDLVATDVLAINGPGGDIETLTSSIGINAAGLILESEARILVNGKADVNTATLTIQGDLIDLQVIATDSVTGRVNIAETTISANQILSQVNSTKLGATKYSLEATQTLLANQFAVNIVEDGNGKSYATGFQLLLNPIWLSGEDYPLDVKVVYGNVVYLCILAHTSAAGNAPGVDPAYWTAQPDDTKSEFIVNADTFKVLTSTSADPVFSVAGDVISLNSTYVNIPTTLIVGSIGADPASVKSALSLAAMAYLSSVGFSNLDGTIISGTKIQTSLINTGAITVGELNGGAAVLADAANGVLGYNSTVLWKYPGQTFIDGGKIYTNSITANQINVSNLAALSVNTGLLNVGTTGSLRGGKTSHADPTAGFWMGYDGGTYKLAFGNSSKSILWNGSTLTVTGDIIATGNIQDLAVNTGKLDANAATEITGDSGLSTDYTLTHNFSTHSTANISVQFSMVGYTTCTVNFYAGTTLIWSAGGEGGMYSGGRTWSTVAAGSYSFKVQGTLGGATGYPCIIVMISYK